MIRIAPALAVGALLLGTGQGFAQEESPQAPGRTAQVVVAAMEWYTEVISVARSDEFRTLVVAGMTDGWEALPPGAPRLSAGPEGPPQNLNLPPAAFRRLAARSGMSVEVCDTIEIETNSLCGISGPWVWFVYNLPAITGNTARVTLDVRWLEWGDPPVGDGTRRGIKYDLHLTRQQGEWTVTSSHPGVS